MDIIKLVLATIFSTWCVSAVMLFAATVVVGLLLFPGGNSASFLFLDSAVTYILLLLVANRNTTLVGLQIYIILPRN